MINPRQHWVTCWYSHSPVVKGEAAYRRPDDSSEAIGHHPKTRHHSLHLEVVHILSWFKTLTRQERGMWSLHLYPLVVWKFCVRCWPLKDKKFSFAESIYDLIFPLEHADERTHVGGWGCRSLDCHAKSRQPGMLRQNQVERWCRSKTGETQADAEVAEKQGGEPVKHPLVHQPAIDRGEGGVSRSKEHKEEAGGCRGEAISLCQEWLQRGKTPVDHFTVL